MAGAGNDWSGSSGDEVWSGAMQMSRPFWRGALLMWTLYGAHQSAQWVPALGYWWCVLAAFTLGSISGATFLRRAANAEWRERKRVYDARQHRG